MVSPKHRSQIALAMSLGIGLGGEAVVVAETHELPRFWRSAYFAPRGDTGIAEADQEEAIFYNPAGIAQGEGVYKRTVFASPQFEVSNSTKDLVRKVGAEEADVIKTMREAVGKHQTLSTSNFSGILLRRAAIGAFANANVKTLVSKSVDEGGLEVIDAYVDQNLMVTFTLAEAFFNETIFVGVTTKYVKRSIGVLSLGLSDVDDLDAILENEEDYTGTGAGTGADLGVMYRGKGRTRFSLGAMVHNIGDTSIIPDEKTNVPLNLKQSVDIGLSIEPRTRTSTIKMLLDLHDVTSRHDDNFLKKIHLGGELSVLDSIGVTGGLHQGYPTGGFYTDLRFVRVDVGLYTVEIGERVGGRPDTRIIFRLKAAL